jgi:hypothetical protein
MADAQIDGELSDGDFPEGWSGEYVDRVHRPGYDWSAPHGRG